MDRVLIVRLGALGDIVHAVPVAAALRRAFPAARIDWVVSAKHRAILDLVPIIDRRFVINDRDRGPGLAERGVGDLSPLSAIRELRRGKYDVAIDVQGLLKSAVLARASGASRVIGFSSRYLRERLARLFYTETHDPAAPQSGRSRSEGAPSDGTLSDRGLHVVRLNLSLLEPLGITTSEPGFRPEFPIAHVDTAAARDARARTGNRYAVLNPGAAWPNKRWPPARFGAVARALRDNHGLASLVLWGPGEEPLATEVGASGEGAALVLPPTSVADVVALLRGAALMVSGDTGPMHIAAAVETPIVGIFGPTRPARNGPWSPDDVTVSRDQDCQCHHLRRCRRETMCVADIRVEEVVRAIERRLTAGPSSA